MSPSRPARRRAAREGCWWRERPPLFLPLVRHRPVLTGARSGARLTLASGGRSLHSNPCGKAVESARKPTAENSRPQMALRPREASLGDVHNPISPICSTGSLPLHLTAPDSALILSLPVRQRRRSVPWVPFQKEGYNEGLQAVHPDRRLVTPGTRTPSGFQGYLEFAATCPTTGWPLSDNVRPVRLFSLSWYRWILSTGNSG